MPASFHVDAGPFRIDVQLDDAGINMERAGFGPAQTKSIPWEKVTGATLITPDAQDTADGKSEEHVAQFLGPEAVQKYHELKGKVGQICVAYRDEKNALQQTEIPVLLTDTAYLEEFQTRLGKRWLGETQDRQRAAKRLHTNPGFFRTVVVLAALLGIVAVVGVVLFFGLIYGAVGPVLNLLSIQKMLLDLQDGNFISFGYRLASYLALFVIGYFLHRVIRSLIDARKRRLPRTIFFQQ